MATCPRKTQYGGAVLWDIPPPKMAAILLLVASVHLAKMVAFLS
jgi:hypothetical protein